MLLVFAAYMLARALDPLRRFARLARASRHAPKLRAFALVLVGLEATYLVGANAFLSSKQLQSIISAEDGTLRLAYDGLWTIVPGRYHVTGLRIAGRTHSTQWQLDIDRASFTCNVFSLFRRRFDVSRVDGEGVRFRLRLPETVADKGAPRNIGEPAIPWFDATDWPPPSDEVTPPDERWTVDIEGVSVATRELWVDRFRHIGPGRATGKFTLTPSGGFEVGPAKLVIPSGQITVGEDVVASAFAADVSCRIGFFPLPIRDNAPEVLRVLSTRVIGEAQIADLRFLNPTLSRVAVADGSGLASFDLDVLQGLVTERSTVRYDTDRVSVDVHDDDFGLGFTGPAFATFQGGLDRGEARVGSERLALRRPDHDASGAPPSARDLALTLFTTRPQLGDGWSLTGFRASVGEVEVPDVRFLGFPALTRANVGLLHGSATARGSLAFENGAVQSGHVRLLAQDLRTRIGPRGHLVNAQIAARADAVPGEKPGTFGIAHGRLDLNDVEMHVAGRDFSHWWTNIQTHDGAVSLGPKPGFVGGVELRAKNAYPALLFALEGEGLTGWLREHLRTDPVDARLGVAARADKIDVHVGHANGGPFGTTGHLRLEKEAGVCGAFLFTQRGEQKSDTPLSLGIAFRGSDASFVPTASNEWLDERIKGLCPPRTAKRAGAARTPETF